MPREVTGEDGTRWSCAQAYAGLSENSEGGGAAAERVDSEGGRVEVVCTPSGGAKTARVELAADWETALTDEELLREIEAHRET